MTIGDRSYAIGMRERHRSRRGFVVAEHAWRGTNHDAVKLVMIHDSWQAPLDIPRTLKPPSGHSMPANARH